MIKHSMLTIFTPTYNRAHTLGRVYRSLCRQTCRDFEWLIIDDGSRDNTRQLVQSWIDEQPDFHIRYVYQANQGMHGAHNTAYDNITTELNTCIDSDDFMPDDAVEKILTFWKKNGSSDYAGIVGLDCDVNGNVIGAPFPEELKETTLSGYYQQGGRGDKKLVYRTDVIKKYPAYPLFSRERYFSLGYKYLLIDQDYLLLVLNEPLVKVDYQNDGSSHSMYRQYWNNPQGFMFLRREHIRLHDSLRMRVKSCIHYVSHCLRAKKYTKLLSSGAPVLTFFMLPAGTCLYLYTYFMVKSNRKMNFGR